MKSIIIEVNGVEVTCYEDGSIEKFDRKKLVMRRTFGCNLQSGYKQVQVGKKHTTIHRLIAKAFIGNCDHPLTVDHINGNKSDNRPENLRILSRSDNLRAFMRKKKGASSVYRGVSWDSWHKKWKAFIQIDGKLKHLGRYDDEVEAAEARDRAAISNGYFPESLNFK